MRRNSLVGKALASAVLTAGFVFGGFLPGALGIQQADAAVRCGKADRYRVVKIVRGGTSCREAKKVVRLYTRTGRVSPGWRRIAGGAGEGGGLESIFLKKRNKARVKVFFLG